MPQSQTPAPAPSPAAPARPPTSAPGRPSSQASSSQAQPRMTLASIRSGARPAPDRILLYGVEGIGKSTFAAEAPSPVFIAAEDGVRHLDVSAFPEPRTWTEVLEALASLHGEHAYRTVVVDTLDWLEPLVHEHVCRMNGWKDIEAPGYGKGYVPATSEFRRMLAELDRLRSEKGMEIILLAHAAIKPFSNPAGPDYARYELKLQKSASALVKEWTDVNLFAVHEQAVIEGEGMTKAKAVSTGRRVMHTERAAAWDAKNRYSLPPVLPLSYADYVEARTKGQPADPAALLAEGLQLLESVPKDVAKKAKAHLEEVKGDAAALYRAVVRLRTLAGGNGTVASGADGSRGKE